MIYPRELRFNGVLGSSQGLGATPGSGSGAGSLLPPDTGLGDSFE
jgi:hypothetical protein